MKEKVADYAVSLYRDIPISVYEGLLSVLFLWLVVIIVCYGLKRGWRKILGLLFAEYVFVIYCSTVFFRAINELPRYNFTPFWSYAASSDGCIFSPDKFMNIMVFIPVGLLIGITFRSANWWKAMIGGIVISSGIEFLQLLLRRGMSELDDVMHNTIGCMVGYFVVCLFTRLTCNSVRTIIKNKK